MHTDGGNTLLVAQYKAGKTTLQLNLIRALADRERFLGRFKVRRLDGRVGFLNYEMNADQFRDWMRDVDVRNPHRVAEPLHLRGHAFRFWEPDTADEFVAWLTEAEVEFLIIDPASQAWRSLVESENDNSQIDLFTHTLDSLKRRAGVRDLLLAHHTGRASFEEGKERARGATRLEDWMDHGWYLTKESGEGRALRAIGRDVELNAIDLEYLATRRELRFSGQTREERKASDGAQRVVEALAEFDRRRERPKTSQLEDAMTGEQGLRNRWIQEAERTGLIRRERSGRALVCELTEKGRKSLERRVEYRPTKSRRSKRRRT